MAESEPKPPGRRRFIRISAAMSGLALLPMPDGHAAAHADTAGKLRIWHGTALGADATMQLHHPDPVAADALVARCLREARRLEQVFSLYRPGSAISRLNRAGHLDDPPMELVELLGISRQFSGLTGGAFDVTVQPLWTLYAAHFSAPDANPRGPAPERIATALRRVGAAGVQVSPTRLGFTTAGMQITLNGIAQGYITDRIVALLRAEGIDRSLVDMGEIRTIGTRPDGHRWTVGLQDPEAPDRISGEILIANEAVATSGGYGTLLDPAGRFNHIFDPATGGSSTAYRSVSVVAPTATMADALSTGFCLMPLAACQEVADRLGIRAHFVLSDGTRLVLRSRPGAPRQQSRAPAVVSPATLR